VGDKDHAHGELALQVASVLLELCGVTSTLGSSWKGRRDGRRSGSAWVGVLPPDIERGAAEMALFQGGIQRILVDDRRPRDVDQ
jgi:hypothetical protein